jgi:hypothetical protein
MDQSSTDVETEAEKPEDKDDDNDCFKHRCYGVVVAATGAVFGAVYVMSAIPPMMMTAAAMRPMNKLLFMLIQTGSKEGDDSCNKPLATAATG